MCSSNIVVVVVVVMFKSLHLAEICTFTSAFYLSIEAPWSSGFSQLIDYDEWLASENCCQFNLAQV